MAKSREFPKKESKKQNHDSDLDFYAYSRLPEMGS